MARRSIALAPWLAAAAVGLAGGCVRADQDYGDSGPLTASLQELNGGLTLPAVELSIVPNVVATSVKVFVRAIATSGPPNCLYGVYASDPRYLPGGSLGEQQNNGLLLVALADDNILNSDPSLGSQERTSCPDSTTYSFMGHGVGGALPDNIQIGDSLQVAGQLTPYCDSYDKQAYQCGTPVFPEFTVTSLTDLGSGPSPAPVPVGVAEIEDGTNLAVDYAGMLVQVSNVVLIAPNADSNGSVVVQAQGVDGGPLVSGLWVDPLTTTVVLPETQGQVFSQITGDMHFITGHWRLQPRSASDVVIPQ